MPPAAAHSNPAHAPAPPVPAQTSSGPGMFAQMAATAGSVAVGSTIGHGISSMLFGSSSSAAPAEPAAPVQQQQAYQTTGAACEVQAKEFTKCLDKADLPSCTWYLDQLKAVRIHSIKHGSVTDCIFSAKLPLLPIDLAEFDGIYCWRILSYVVCPLSHSTQSDIPANESTHSDP